MAKKFMSDTCFCLKSPYYISLIDIEEVLEKLRACNVKRVAIQLPEGLKREAPKVASALRAAGYEVLISGDACWGACDLASDALTDADVLVHFGHTKVTEEKNIIYIPFRQSISPDILEDAVLALAKYQTVSLTTTIQHAHQMEEISAWLKDRGVNTIIGRGSPRTPECGQVLGCTYAAAKTNADANLFIGTGVFHAIGVSLASGKPTFALDPFGLGKVQEVSADRLLRQRFVQIEKAKDAKNFGILLSGKSGQKRLQLAEKLSLLHPNASIILIREISEMQLRNLGFDAYVNTACPRLALDDQARFPMPVLSPAEFEITLGLRDWEDYVIDEIV